MSKTWKHFDTTNSANITASLTEACEQRICVLIEGRSGMGKSHTALRFKKDIGCYLVRCKGFYSIKNFIIEIAKAVGVKTSGDKATICEAIIGKLKNDYSEGKSPFLIIDEAQNIKDSGFDFIQDFWDSLLDDDNCCGLALLGATGYISLLEKRAGERKRNYDQLYTRLESGFVPELYMIEKDIVDICKQMEITDNWVISYFKLYTDFRTLKHDIEKLIRNHEESGEPITEDLVGSCLERRYKQCGIQTKKEYQQPNANYRRSDSRNTKN